MSGYKDLLAQRQPAVYRILNNALKSDGLSHCYLFAGPRGTGKKQAAFLLAQSLVCEQADPFGCEECVSCRRITDNSYADLVYLDGSRTIKTEAVEKLQKQFRQTALEKAGRKIFIITDCENMTAKAANSLLKFIEEPAGEMTGIFTTTAPNRVLPTILSRCQTISFRPLARDDFLETARQEGIDEMNAHFLSSLVSESSQISTLYGSESYRNALTMFMEFTRQLLSDRNNAVLYLQNHMAVLNRSARNEFRDTLKLFLEISLIFAQDCLDHYDSSDEEYAALLQQAGDADLNCPLYISALSGARDALNRQANGLLAADQLLYRLMEV